MTRRFMELGRGGVLAVEMQNDARDGEKSPICAVIASKVKNAVNAVIDWFAE